MFGSFRVSRLFAVLVGVATMCSLLLLPVQAGAAMCSVTPYGMSGSPAYGLQDGALSYKHVRSKGFALICVTGKAGSLKIVNVTCSANWVNLRDWDITRTWKSTRPAFTDTRARCTTKSNFQRHRSILRDEYACGVYTLDRWALNQKTGAMTRIESRPSNSVFTKDNCTSRDVDEKPDTLSPVLDKPLASLASPTSRTANYTINATDNVGVTEMRVKATGDAAWRSWVPYQASGTVILPDRYGDFNVWFQVRDAAGNVSSQRASDIITRVQDTTGPTITGASVALGHHTWQAVNYSLNASDSLSQVTQMRVLVSGGDWRPWVPYASSGTVLLPADGYGTFGITFQVADSAGNVSQPAYAGAVTRTADVGVGLRQIDNNGNLRSCGSTEAAPCSDVVKRFRISISSARVPDTNVLLKAWRKINGTWTETSTSPFMYEWIGGRTTIDMTVTANLLNGLWRFQAQVPRSTDGSTAFGSSEYQYLLID